jgi:hypothetical protein
MSELGVKAFAIEQNGKLKAHAMAPEWYVQITAKQLAGAAAVPVRILREEDAARMEEAINAAWVIVANAYGGDWTQASAEWKKAAEAWRDTYYNPPAEAILKAVEQAEKGAKPQDQIYMLITFKHGFVGNDVLFWGKNCCGYTCIIEEAGRYTAEEAMSHRVPGETYVVPESWVLANCRRVIETQRAGGTLDIKRVGDETASKIQAEKGE